VVFYSKKVMFVAKVTMAFASNYHSACILVWQLEFHNSFRIMRDGQTV